MNPSDDLEGLDLEELERVAKAATPGPWTVTAVKGRWAVKATYMKDGLRHHRWPACCDMATDAEIIARLRNLGAEVGPLAADTIERLLKERDEARQIVADCNNSIFGSWSYFTADGDKTLVCKIEDLKAYGGEQWRRSARLLSLLGEVAGGLGEIAQDAEFADGLRNPQHELAVLRPALQAKRKASALYQKLKGELGEALT
jgi:hypothetical protein